ncbi:MAG: hypothetical protein CVU50_04430 [Candidatus Cloacimonetes bacterium HGW-Cloacimonetes-3]|jgi:hypothetical protein|nr:MAG: hypothetical protein CVU50_04430 [Candidatus Cloacimonetes bacterium HGW-Cloacimonetes-3]
MRKYLICLLVILFGLNLAAQDSGKNQVKFALISSPVYDLDLRLSNELRRIYVTAQFSVKQDSLNVADYYSFFVNQDVRIEQIFINEKLTAPILTTNLQAEHFIPVLPVPALLDTNSVMICYSFKQSDMVSKADSLSFKVKFWVPTPEWQPNSDGSSMIGYLTDHYWFPRNIETSSTVNIKLLSSAYYRLEIERPCLWTDNSGIRTHRGCFQDSPGRSTFLKIIKG